MSEPKFNAHAANLRAMRDAGVLAYDQKVLSMAADEIERLEAALEANREVNRGALETAIKMADALRAETAKATAERDEALVLLKDAREHLGDCEPPEAVACDDEDGGFGRARRSQWCGGPCVIRERIDAALAGAK